MFHKILVVILFFTSVIPLAFADPLLDEANQSIAYLKKHVVTATNADTINVTTTETAISSISKVLESYNIPEEAEISIRGDIGVSLYKINLKRHLNGNRIDFAQAEQAKENLDFVITKSINPYILFIAGHNALHLLQRPLLASDYWEKCANLKHSGCMNAMAQHNFTGENGLPINLLASVDWHKKVFDTGLKYNCAGIFSSHALMLISHHLNNLNTGGTWEYWKAQRDILLNDLKDEGRFKSNNFCSLNNLLTVDFLLAGAQGPTALNFLDKAIAITTDTAHIDALLVMKNGHAASKALEFIPHIKSSATKCEMSLNLALYANYTDQKEEFSRINDFMTTLSFQECPWELALKQHMQTAGYW